MREPPSDLSEEALRASLRALYGLDSSELTFLPLGQDALAAVYRARTVDGRAYFLKARRGSINEPGLMVPHYLHDAGISEVIAPIASATGRLWTSVGEYTLVLFPFVEGTSGKQGGLTPEQWHRYGQILRRIHATRVSTDLAQRMRHEEFMPAGGGLIRDLDAYLDDRSLTDLAEHSVVAFWTQRRAEIHLLVRRAEDLGRQLAGHGLPDVLCHADFHTANVLVDTEGSLWVVDWDDTVLAPKERDLMFVVGGGISDRLVRPQDEALFFQGYGPTAVDSLALAYYRYTWAVSDISAYGAQVFLRPDLGSIDRQESGQRLADLFAPGQIVAKALATPLQ